MKTVAALFFTILYTVFISFAATGTIAADYEHAMVKTATCCSLETVAPDNDSKSYGYTNNLHGTIHVYHKQTNNAGGGNNYNPLNKLAAYTDHPFNKSFTCAGTLPLNNVLPVSCPLFIKYRVLII